MSADPDNLEALSNDELRHQMAILGLPKVPITDTTRKVLIKRIRNHLKEAKAKTRRETVAVVKYSSDEDVAAEPETGAKAKTNRRATVAAPVAVKVPERAPQLLVKPQRRSGRITPTAVSLGDVPPPMKVAMGPIVSHIIEDSDEDMEDVLTQRPPPPRRSKSKSPSLSRSDVVTTSYKQVIESVKESPEEEEEENGMDVDEPPRPPSRPSQPYYRPLSAYKVDSGLENRRTIGGGYSGTRYTSSSYSPYESRYSTLSTQYSQKRESQPRQLDDGLETPYLSNFTRRLSQLKAHKIDAGTSSSIYRADSSTTQKPTSSISGSIVALFNALDRKYSLKRNLLILSAVLIVIFLFVLFLY